MACNSFRCNCGDECCRWKRMSRRCNLIQLIYDLYGFIFIHGSQHTHTHITALMRFSRNRLHHSNAKQNPQRFRKRSFSTRKRTSCRREEKKRKAPFFCPRISIAKTIFAVSLIQSNQMGEQLRRSSEKAKNTTYGSHHHHHTQHRPPRKQKCER